jgi:dienelactone hydrolase
MIVALLQACSRPARTEAMNTHPSSRRLQVADEAEEVSFPSRDADLTNAAPTQLTGLLFRPIGEGPFPAIVALHGCGALLVNGGLGAHHRDWALRLKGLGYVVLMPDSFAPRGVTEVCTLKNSPVRPGEERVRDTYGALVYLQSLPFVRHDRIGLMGWSHGGGTILHTVGAHVSARPKDLAHDYKVAIAFYPGCSKVVKRADWGPNATPLTILMGDKDDWTPVAPCLSFVEHEKAKGHHVDIVAYPGALHGFEFPDQKVHTRDGVATDTGTVSMGTDPAARDDAIARVTALLEARLLR